MKLCLFFAALLGFAAAAPSSRVSVARSNELSDIIAEYFDYIDIDSAIGVVIRYMSEDEEVQQALTNLQGDDFKTAVAQFNEIEEYKTLLSNLADIGLDLYWVIEGINQLLGIDNYPTAFIRSGTTGGIEGLTKELLACIDIDGLEAKHLENLETSAVYRAVLAQVNSAEMKVLVAAVKSNEYYQSVLASLSSIGIDVSKVIAFFENLASSAESLSRHARDLSDHLQDFLALVPLDSVVEIAIRYLAEDEQTQQLLFWIESSETKAAIAQFNEMEEFAALLAELSDSGLNLYGVIATINEFLGIDNYPQQASRVASRGTTGGLRGLFDELIAVLPVDEIKALHQEKLANSADYKALFQGLSSSEMTALVDAVKSNEIYQSLLSQLESFGLDVDRIRDFFENIVATTA